MEKKIVIQCPLVPNFLKPEGMDEPISIREFTEEELRQVAAEWTEELIKKSQRK
ncbi:MAG: hypothetical protein WCT51_04850 [Candidatus Shapirobacteria bacterium]|jgi:hypothetical protein